MIVLAFGKETLLRECVRSVEAAREVFGDQGELIVVLNGVSPALRRELENSPAPRVLVDPGRNLGFAGGVMAGLERAQGEWVALFNDDCVVEPAALGEMVATGSSRRDVGSVAAQVLFSRSGAVVNSAGIEIDELGIAYERLLGEPAGWTGDDGIAGVFGASGAAALYRRAMLDDVGGFDESFFAYLEDADLAWRARMRGWDAVHAPRAIVRHHHSASLGHGSSAKYYLVGRNRVRMLAKNAMRAQLLRHGLRMVLYDVSYVLYVVVRKGTAAPLRGRLRGLAEWRRYRAAGAPHRRAIYLPPAPGIRGALQRDRVYGKS